MYIYIYMYIYIGYIGIRKYSVSRGSSFHRRRRGSFTAKNHTHAVVPFGREIFTDVL